MRELLGALVVTFLAVACEAAAPFRPPVDDHGDPLPQGAVARIGSLRWRGVWGWGLAWSPDGKRIAAPCRSASSVCLWDVQTGRVVRRFHGHHDYVRGVAFAPDGRLLSFDDGGRAFVWDSGTGRRLLTVALPMTLEEPARKQAPSAGAFCDRGKAIAFLWENSLLRFDSVTGKELGAHSPVRFRPCLSADGERFADLSPGNNEGDVTVRDVASAKVVRKFTFPKGAEEAFLSRDGGVVGVRGRDGPARVWRVSDGKELGSVPAEELKGISWLSLTPDGKASLGDGERGPLWDVATGKRLREFAGLASWAYPRAFSPDGKRLAVKDRTGQLAVWDVATGKALVAPDDEVAPCNWLAFTPDSKSLIGYCSDATVRHWDVPTRRLVRTIYRGKAQGALDMAAVSPDGKLVVVFDRPLLALFDLATGKEACRLTAPPKAAPHGPLFSADSRTLFALDRGSVLRWEVRTGKPLPAWKSERFGSFDHLERTDGGKTLAALDRSRAEFWDVATGASKRTIGPVESSNHRSCLSPDGKEIATISSTGDVVIGSTSDGKKLRGWAGQGGEWDVNYSADGKGLVSRRGWDGFGAWEAATGKEVRLILGDEGAVTAVAFSPDGKWLATAGPHSILIWPTSVLRDPPVHRLTADELEVCWSEFAQTRHDPIWWRDVLRASGRHAADRVRERLTPFDAKKAAKLLKLVAGEGEAARRAADDLVRLGPGVLSLIDSAMKGEADPDVKLRLTVVRSRLAPDAAEEAARAPHVIAALRQTRNDQAAALLEDMAAGLFGPIWQTAAKAKAKR